MWLAPKLGNLPRTQKSFYLTSTNGEKFLVKPGKAFIFRNSTWNLVRAVGNLNNKISRVVISPTGNTSLHLPKMTGLLATHMNNADALVITLPLPSSAHVSRDAPITATDTVAPSGEAMVVTSPHQTVGDMPFIFGLQNKKMSDFPSHVHGLATSENGEAIALAVDDQFWIWQQLPEYEKGIGFWLDLTSNQRFSVGVESNHPISQSGRVYHGYMRPQQYFTLHPVLAPNLPQNSAISYQDLCMFDNPDEGRGICCLTALLPPCKPFDTLYLFNSICTFKGFKPVFQRADITLPVFDEASGPCVWWSRDCRLAVIAVGNNLIIVTRFLRPIAIIPLNEIFAGNDLLVSDVAWSCGGQFFLLTSTQGKIGAVTRSGKSMRHSICHLTPFSDKKIPLMISGDSKDPSLFVVYSNEKWRELKIDISMIPQTLENLMSLHFPQKSVYPYWEPTIKEIKETGFVDIPNLIKLLYLTDLYRIWPYQSPLRYLLFQLFEAGVKNLLNTNQDLYAFLLIRCILRLTELPVSSYQVIIDRLKGSKLKRDKLLLKIIQDELDKKDYVISKTPSIGSNIKMYDPTEEDKEQMMELKQPHNGRNIDLFALVKAVKNLLYASELDPEIYEINVNLALLMEIMVQFGRFDRAILLAKHPSIASDPTQLYHRIASLHPDEPGLLFRAMTICIKAAPDDEMNIRAVCVKALTNILKQRIADSSPTAASGRTKLLSSIIIIEEDLELIVPENVKQLDDFAVILGIAFAAAHYPACSNYFNGKSNLIPEYLRYAVRELFSLVWFIRWRHAAIFDTAKTGHASNATLRLLAFPEFVNQRAARAQIYAAGEAMFSPDIYVLYMNGGSSPMYEKDPIFVDFAAECSNRITPRALSRISAAVMQLSNADDDIPRSGILFATIISHIIPWLRCGIPRALSGFKCNDVVPNELLEFEDFSLPQAPPPEMKIETNVLFNDGDISEEEEVIEPPPPPPKPKPVIPPEESSSEGEFIPEPEPEPVKPKRRPTKHSQKPKPKPKPHHRKKPVKDNTPSGAPPPRGPKLKLLSLDPNAAPPRTSPAPNFNYLPPQPQVPPYFMQQMPQRPYNPIWDYDPSKWAPKPKEKPPPQKEDVPVQAQVETKPVKSKPLVIISSKQKQPKKPDDFTMSSTSSLSDIAVSEPRKGPIPNVDPFPIDDDLHNRIEKLLDEAEKSLDPNDLPPPPQFTRPSMKPKPPKPKKVYAEPSPAFEPGGNMNGNPNDSHIPINQAQSQRQPDWRPKLTSIRDPQVIGIQEITLEQFRQGSIPSRTQLQEIRPNSGLRENSGQPRPAPATTTTTTKTFIAYQEKEQY
ncbi:hypothetical protein TRFO_07018 [Tritrichomonas foetus]|uniref:Uncharacterized protein n=1 Tax=Tritrichomonas foetus TaxID=1144522 RepID=A0A1J4JYM9_9EUKA|nr:hypothetical protein TRFO_07018 [Tritrichomonas foetus]|eukprot:OHT02606.1 hypothetical protein TRFO_07018 [Tritrichomonas foetus]